MKLLWLSNETPNPAGQGGQRRQFFQIESLAKSGHDITVCTLAGPQEDDSLNSLAEVIRTESRWKGLVRSPRHGRLLRSLRGGDWDGVVVAHTESWRTFSSVCAGSNHRVWVDLHNVLGIGIDGRKTVWFEVEEDICRAADTVSVCSMKERERLVAQQEGINISPVVMPHGLNLSEWTWMRKPRGVPVVKLFGNWSWGPNQRGLSWFLDQVWPLVCVPGARCEVAGTGAQVHAVSSSNAEFVGRVADLGEWLSDAWVVAVPVVGGVGAPLKYLEALASKAPVLSTQDGAAYAAEWAIVSDDAEFWSVKLNELLGGDVPTPDMPLDVQEFSWHVATEPLMKWCDG